MTELTNIDFVIVNPVLSPRKERESGGETIGEDLRKILSAGKGQT